MMNPTPPWSVPPEPAGPIFASRRSFRHPNIPFYILPSLHFPVSVFTSCLQIEYNPSLLESPVHHHPFHPFSTPSPLHIVPKCYHHNSVSLGPAPYAAAAAAALPLPRTTQTLLCRLPLSSTIFRFPALNHRSLQITTETRDNEPRRTRPHRRESKRVCDANFSCIHI